MPPRTAAEKAKSAADKAKAKAERDAKRELTKKAQEQKKALAQQAKEEAARRKQEEAEKKPPKKKAKGKQAAKPKAPKLHSVFESDEEAMDYVEPTDPDAIGWDAEDAKAAAEAAAEGGAVGPIADPVKAPGRSATVAAEGEGTKDLDKDGGQGQPAKDEDEWVDEDETRLQASAPSDADRARVFKSTLVPVGDVSATAFNTLSASSLNSGMAKFLGFARTQIAPGNIPTISFSNTNNRTLNTNIVSKMGDEMLWDGVKNVSLESVLHIVLPPSAFAVNARERLALWRLFDLVKDLNPSTADRVGWPFLIDIVKEGVGNVDGLGGQHRSHAIEIALKRAQQLLDETIKNALTLETKRNKARRSAEKEGL
ncbi:hypothetical protein PsYK624_148240 [Phanerochaete sordida]|uniref:Uncharacterized protein n=1 Tax=Phanerochaete sordida TaxID=48140 RepID=A0A9P3LKQ5_9APHY|nr:hypothetical protein PsYK624_148240 [Phanerochaete sordida]